MKMPQKWITANSLKLILFIRHGRKNRVKKRTEKNLFSQLGKVSRKNRWRNNDIAFREPINPRCSLHHSLTFPPEIKQ